MPRTRLSNMRYNRVDLVDDGANQYADIMLAKRNVAEPQVIRKALGSVRCNSCGSMVGKNRQRCTKCGSYNLSKIRVEVIKTVQPIKAEPKNDSSNRPTNNDMNTFEDSQLDQDDDENGVYIDEGDEGDDAQMQAMNKRRRVSIRKDDISDVDNTINEDRDEGEDNDDDIEEMAEDIPDGDTEDDNNSNGYQSTSTTSSDSTGMVNKKRWVVRKGTAGLSTVDHGDEGSQEVVENAEQMYRSESMPLDTSEDDPTDNTRAKVVKGKMRKVSIPQGTDSALDNGHQGIYQNGIEENDEELENGDGTGSLTGTTSADRSSVSPPGNPNDINKRRRIRKIRKSRSHAGTEVLSLSIAFAENLAQAIQKGNTSSYNSIVKDFVDTLHAGSDLWFNNQSITKRNNRLELAEEISKRVERILKADDVVDPADQMSDDVSAGQGGEDVTDDDPGVKVPHTPTQVDDPGDVTGMVNKSKEEDIYKGLHPEIIAKLKAHDDLVEKNAVNHWEQIAKNFGNIPGTNATELAKSLRVLHETDEERYEEVAKALTAANAQLADNAILKQIGISGAQTDTSDPLAKARAYAQEHVSKGKDGPTEEVLIAQYMMDNPGEFYQSTVKGL